MKKNCLIALLLISMGNYAQYQVKKGRWVISHTIGGFSHTKFDFKQYEEGLLDQEGSMKQTTFFLGFSGPDWGDISYYGTNQEDENTGYKSKSSNWGIYLQPNAGFFVRYNLMIGASALLGFDRSRSKAPFNSSKGSGMAFGLGPSMRYYFGKNEKRKPFAGFESRFDITRDRSKDFYTGNFDGDHYVHHADGTRLMARPFVGYAWFLGKRWTADARFDYTYVKENSKRNTWYYENEALGTGYPQHEKYEQVLNTLAVSFGLSYTF